MRRFYSHEDRVTSTPRRVLCFLFFNYHLLRTASIVLPSPPLLLLLRPSLRRPQRVREAFLALVWTTDR